MNVSRWVAADAACSVAGDGVVDRGTTLMQNGACDVTAGALTAVFALISHSMSRIRGSS